MRRKWWLVFPVLLVIFVVFLVISQYSSYEELASGKVNIKGEIAGVKIVNNQLQVSVLLFGNVVHNIVSEGGTPRKYCEISRDYSSGKITEEMVDGVKKYKRTLSSNNVYGLDECKNEIEKLIGKYVDVEIMVDKGKNRNEINLMTKFVTFGRVLKTNGIFVKLTINE